MCGFSNFQMALISSCDFISKFVFGKSWPVAYDWCPSVLSNVKENDTGRDMPVGTAGLGPQHQGAFGHLL